MNNNIKGTTVYVMSTMIDCPHCNKIIKTKVSFTLKHFVDFLNRRQSFVCIHCGETFRIISDVEIVEG